MRDPSSPVSGLSAALADRYRIEPELGQGGMATVYLAHDVKHDRMRGSSRVRAAPEQDDTRLRGLLEEGVAHNGF